MFNQKYGGECWPLLYQQDVRFRHEEMPEILRREDIKLSQQITSGTWVKGVGLNRTSHGIAAGLS